MAFQLSKNAYILSAQKGRTTMMAPAQGTLICNHAAGKNQLKLLWYATMLLERKGFCVSRRLKLPECTQNKYYLYLHISSIQ